MRAFDPSGAVDRPQNSDHPNLFYYNVGIDYYNHQKTYNDEFHTIELQRTLEYLIEENGDLDKTISYLKMDVEGKNNSSNCYQKSFWNKQD